MRFLNNSYMKQFNNRRGAVELSLNLIIMLIIGLVVMGLVIGFVTNLIGGAQSNFITQLDAQDEARIEEAKNCANPFCVIPPSNIRVTQGGQAKVFFGVRAVAGDISINPGPMGTGTDLITMEVFDSGGNQPSTGVPTLSGPGFSAALGTVDGQMYTLSTTTALAKGEYFIIFKYFDTDPNGAVSTTQRAEQRVLLTIE